MVSKRIEHVFMVRLWAETIGESAPPDWRGVVEHAASGQRRYFTSLDDLLAFLQAQLATSSAPPLNTNDLAHSPTSENGGLSSA